MPRSVTSCILVVDPDKQSRQSLSALLRSLGHTVDAAEDLRGALGRLDSAVRYDLLMCTPRLTDGDVLEVLPRLKAQRAAPTLLLLAERAAIPQVARLLRLGAAAYIGKPLVADEVRATVQHHLEHRRLVKQNELLRAAVARHKRPAKLIVQDKKMQAILDEAEQLAATRSCLLIAGGPGSGKKAVAEWVHSRSAEHRASCVCVDCSAASSDALLQRLAAGDDAASSDSRDQLPSAVVQASGGTLIVEHVDGADPAVQARLLHLVEHSGARAGSTLDVRLIFTTGADLEHSVSIGSFRQDIYYAIKGFRIDLPELRDRPADIMPLARHFLHAASVRLSVKPPVLARDAIAALAQYAWPGNVEELEQLMQKMAAVAVDGRVSAVELSSALQCPTEANGRAAIHSLRQALEESERQILGRALRLNNWNRQKTAEMLKVNRSTLFNKMKKYSLLGRRGEAQ